MQKSLSLSNVGLMFILVGTGLYLLVYPERIEQEMIETLQQSRYIGFVFAPFISSPNGLRVLSLFFFALVIARLKKLMLVFKIFAAVYIAFTLSLLIAFYDKPNQFSGQKQSEGLQRTAIHLLILSVLLNSLQTEVQDEKQN